MPGATSESQDLPPRYALDDLIAKMAPGVSIRKLEERAGLKEGALAHFLKTPQRGKTPRLEIMERFAHALNANLTDVSRAFAADSYVPPVDVPVMPDDEMELLGLYRRLGQGNRSLARQLLRTMAEHQDDQQCPPVTVE